MRAYRATTGTRCPPTRSLAKPSRRGTTHRSARWRPHALIAALRYDDELGVVVLVKIFADRPEAAALARDIENGAIIGFSLYTDYEELVPEGAEYGDVIHIRVTHIGVTKNPAWARVFNDLPIDQQDGSWVRHQGRDAAAMRQVIRDRYMTRPQATIPDEMRRRLTQTEASDRLAISARRSLRLKAVSASSTAFSPGMADAAAAAAAPPATPATPAPPPPEAAAAAPAAPAEPAVPRLTPDKLVQDWSKKREDTIRVTNPMQQYEQLNALQGEIDKAVRNGEISYMDLLMIGKDLPLAIGNQLKALEEMSRGFLEQQRRDGLMSEEAFTTNSCAVDALRQGKVRSLHESLATFCRFAVLLLLPIIRIPKVSPGTRVLCDSVFASASASQKDQKQHEVAREEAKRNAELAVGYKRKNEEMEAKFAAQEKKNAEIEAQLRALNSAAALATTKAAAATADAASVAATPAPLLKQVRPSAPVATPVVPLFLCLPPLTPYCPGGRLGLGILGCRRLLCQPGCLPVGSGSLPRPRQVRRGPERGCAYWLLRQGAVPEHVGSRQGRDRGQERVPLQL